MSPFDMVRQFHALAGVHDADAPDISQHRTLRLRLIDEELRELRLGLINNSVVDVADALADLMYVVIGSALQWGIPLERVFAEVHRSNMTKGGGDKRADGKILKGPGYEPPDLSFVGKVGA
jgi:predicted HAD superfamily Cof-like phosphohydrolase